MEGLYLAIPTIARQIEIWNEALHFVCQESIWL